MVDCIFILLLVAVQLGLRAGPTPSGGETTIEILHPIEGAIMPLNMPAPVLLWKTNIAGVNRWMAGFETEGRKWSFEAIQPMWRPPEDKWRQMKQAAKGRLIEITITGVKGEGPLQTKARGTVRFSIAGETVDDPLFYRDVNLPFSEAVKDPSHIRWRFGTLDKGVPAPVVLANLPVCGNCHSFSRKGEYLAMDVDYENDKGSYVITRTAPEMKLASSDIITWNVFRRDDGQNTLGLLSQISPDGRYVLSTVKDLSVFMAKTNLAFSQLFFPFQGIIGVYDRAANRFFVLPGADDPDFVQSNPTWSPDGQWIVFARARAVQYHGPRGGGRILSSGEEGKFLNQIREFRYDLYRLPFNNGAGGKAEPIKGASRNGRSNYFPKYSPDGRWIVFCQAANYMLLQPDSQLFLIPAEGGEAARLDCNLHRMNSWHSWSSDGRWIAFSSKAHSDYTQLYLARISAQGKAYPPVWLAHMIEPNRAVNIPEFVDLAPGSIIRIREQFLDDNSYVRAGDEFFRAGENSQAIEKYRTALSLNPDNVNAHRQLGGLLHLNGDEKGSMHHLQALARLAPRDANARLSLGNALKNRGDWSNAVVHFEEALRCWPSERSQEPENLQHKDDLPAVARVNLGHIYQQLGETSKAEQHYNEALVLWPDNPEIHYRLGTLKLRSGQIEEAERRFEQTVRLKPDLADAHNCLGIIRQRQNRRGEAMKCFQQAVQLDAGNWQAHLNLGQSYLSMGDSNQAMIELREAVRIMPSSEAARQALKKALNPASPTHR